MIKLIDKPVQSEIFFVKTKAKSRPLNTDDNQQVLVLNGLNNTGVKF